MNREYESKWQSEDFLLAFVYQEFLHVLRLKMFCFVRIRWMLYIKDTFGTSIYNSYNLGVLF